MPVVVETVTKSSTIKTFAAAQPLHDSDASKVTSKGAGLQSAQLNKDATFSIDTGRAGRFLAWVARPPVAMAILYVSLSVWMSVTLVVQA